MQIPKSIFTVKQRITKEDHIENLLQRQPWFLGRSPGQVVMGRDSRSEGLNSSAIFWKKTENKRKRGRGWPILKIFISYLMLIQVNRVLEVNLTTKGLATSLQSPMVGTSSSHVVRNISGKEISPFSFSSYLHFINVPKVSGSSLQNFDSGKS